MMSKTKTLTDQIRDAVKASKLTQYRICEETAIDPASMSKFLSGERDGLSMAALNKLAALLKLRIVSERKDD
jgi:transcriptional regulator with XRE-family HTH domain